MSRNDQLNFDNLVGQANALIRSFTEQDPKPWPVSAKMLDLMTHGGKIAALILEKEGYKKKDSNDTLPIELATLFFIILDIAEEYQIDFKESFSGFLENSKQHLTKKG